MNKTVKTSLMVVGFGLVIYGIYTLIAPEPLVSIGDLSVETQDNTDAYTTIAFGLIAIVLGLVAGKRK
ncbi:hypothetical protein [Aestuariivivens sediminicola]|uniref:hypothetical protein n=1 Tax=Aestuariivivens sediminicola TaxID=2913560 RepID=UPI001F5A3C9B|nr:hypothetical protein [Aestuariivivens sediminicola]